MDYTADDRKRLVVELSIFARAFPAYSVAHLQRPPPCARRLPLHRPLRVADLRRYVDWTVLAPPVAQCEHAPADGQAAASAETEAADEWDEWYECGCRHCRVHATPRNVLQMLLGLLHARDFYTQLEQLSPAEGDELHEGFCQQPHKAGCFLPLPRVLRDWHRAHPSGFRSWRHMLLASFDRLMVRLLTDPGTCYQHGKLATNVMEEIAVVLATYHLDHMAAASDDDQSEHAAGQALLRTLPTCVWDRDLTDTSCLGETLLERMLQDMDCLCLWPFYPGFDEGPWPCNDGTAAQADVHPQGRLGEHSACTVAMRFPLDFVAPFGHESDQLQQLLHRAPRIHMAAFRIHRFWRDVCCSPVYAHARQCILYAASQHSSSILGKRLRQ